MYLELAYFFSQSEGEKLSENVGKNFGQASFIFVVFMACLFLFNFTFAYITCMAR